MRQHFINAAAPSLTGTSVAAINIEHVRRRDLLPRRSPEVSGREWRHCSGVARGRLVLPRLGDLAQKVGELEERVRMLERRRNEES
jgi:hypothetical protein